MRVAPVLGRFFVSDWVELDEKVYDYVMPVKASSMWVAFNRPQDWRQSTLDLGAGCGVQAIVAAENSGTVIATDINPRAAAIGAFNAALNGVSNVEFRTGEWLDPVKSDKFDLIVSDLSELRVRYVIRST